MLKRKFISAKLPFSILAIFICLATNLTNLFAAAQLFEADGDVVMGNIGIENVEIAYEKAKEKALRSASEQASIIIESMSEMKNNTLTRDQIRVFSSSILRVQESKMSSEPVPNVPEVIRYKCHVKVWIDPDEFLKKFGGVTVEKAEDQVRMRKDQDFYREQNENEIVNLRTEYKNASNENERQAVAAKIKRNEEKVTAEQIYQRGAECYNRGDLAEATKFYNQAIEMDSKYAAPWTGLGWIYNDQEQFAKAIECFQKSIALYDKFAVPYNGLSYAYNYSNDFNKAIEYGNKAVQIDSRYAAAWNNIGFAYNNLGNFGKAVEYYNKAISISPNDDIPLANIGNVYYKQKDFAKALEYYQKSVAINSNHASVWYNLGTIYTEKNDFGKAIESYKKATSLEPKNVRAWFMLGYLYSSQKKFEDAKRCLKKSLEINSNDARAWWLLGFAYDGSEDYSNSHEAFKKAVELEPNNEQYQKDLATAKQKL